MGNQNIHTVYDRMAARGDFRKNPANQDAVDPITGQSGYSGPVPFPKMLYHPKGLKRVTMAAEMVATPFGPQMLNEQKELISKVVNNEQELQGLLAIGWHEHPSDAIAAGFTPEEILAGAVAPPKSSATRISSLEEQVKRLTAELAASKTGSVQDDSVKEED